LEAKLEILSDLSLIADYLPEFDLMIEGASNARFSLDDFAPLFLRILPALQAIGVIVVFPKSLHKILKPKINLALKTKEKIKDDRPSFLSLKNLLEFNWQIALGDQAISIEEFKKILKQSGQLVKVMDKYILLDEKEVAELLKQIEKLPESLSQEYLLQAMLAEEIDNAVVSIDNNLKKLVQSFNKYQQLPVPNNLKACLRPYQERGFNWLIQNIHSSFGSILADDMGLGKTI
jgi:SNF2 family DNA or RNA helicase